MEETVNRAIVQLVRVLLFCNSPPGIGGSVLHAIFRLIYGFIVLSHAPSGLCDHSIYLENI